MSAVKHDTGKAPMSLIPRESLEGVAAVLGFGKRKYAAHNWRGGMQWSRLIDAALRHLTAFNDGEDTDPESGLPHLDHAACCLAFLTTYQKQGLGEDNRYRKPVPVVDADVKPLPQKSLPAYRSPTDIRVGDTVTVTSKTSLSTVGTQFNLSAGTPYTVTRVDHDSVDLAEFPEITGYRRWRFVRAS